MKQILKDNLTSYETINIRQNTPILEYLRKENYPYILQNVSHERFLELQNATIHIDIEVKNPVAGFGRLKGNDFGSSGGLKISDPEEKIGGSFVIQKEKIIYDALRPFYHERDSYVYFYGKTYYTDMSMLDLLKEELNRKRKYLVYIGEEFIKYKGLKEVFEEISQEELLEYATNPEKGEYALSRRMNFYNQE